MENKNNSSNNSSSNSSQSSDKGTMDNLLGSLKNNSDVLKGAVAILLGSYLISIKYYVVMDFLLFAAGSALVLYGLACLRVARIQEFVYAIINRISSFCRR